MAAGAGVVIAGELAVTLLDAYFKAAQIAQMTQVQVEAQMKDAYATFKALNPETDIKDV